MSTRISRRVRQAIAYLAPHPVYLAASGLSTMAFAAFGMPGAMASGFALAYLTPRFAARVPVSSRWPGA